MYAFVASCLEFWQTILPLIPEGRHFLLPLFHPYHLQFSKLTLAVVNNNCGEGNCITAIGCLSAGSVEAV